MALGRRRVKNQRLGGCLNGRQPADDSEASAGTAPGCLLRGELHLERRFVVAWPEVDDFQFVVAGLLLRELDVAAGTGAVVRGDSLSSGVVDEEVDVRLLLAADRHARFLPSREGECDRLL